MEIFKLHLKETPNTLVQIVNVIFVVLFMVLLLFVFRAKCTVIVRIMNFVTVLLQVSTQETLKV